MSKEVATKNESVFKDSKTPDRVLDNKSLEEKVGITKAKRVPFKCEVAYNALYPNGFESTYQGIQINLIFDGRTVELPEAIIQYVKEKIEKKALSEMEKRRRNSNPQGAQSCLGNYIV